MKFSNAFRPQIDDQSQNAIEILEDMLRACVLDFNGSWIQYILLIEFANNLIVFFCIYFLRLTLDCMNCVLDWDEWFWKEKCVHIYYGFQIKALFFLFIFIKFFITRFTLMFKHRFKLTHKPLFVYIVLIYIITLTPKL